MAEPGGKGRDEVSESVTDPHEAGFLHDDSCPVCRSHRFYVRQLIRGKDRPPMVWVRGARDRVGHLTVAVDAIPTLWLEVAGERWGCVDEDARFLRWRMRWRERQAARGWRRRQRREERLRLMLGPREGGEGRGNEV